LASKQNNISREEAYVLGLIIIEECVDQC